MTWPELSWGAWSVPVLVDGLDENEFEGAILGDAVDGAIGDVEPDGTMARPLSLERLIVPARGLSSFLEAHSLDGANPSHELADDVGRAGFEILLGFRREGNGANHLGSVAASSRMSTLEIDRSWRVGGLRWKVSRPKRFEGDS